MTNRSPGLRSSRNDFQISFAIIFTSCTMTAAARVGHTPKHSLNKGLREIAYLAVSDFILQPVLTEGLCSFLISRPCLLPSLIPSRPFIWGFKNSESQRSPKKSCNWDTADHCCSPPGPRVIDRVLCSGVHLNRITSGHADPHFTFFFVILMLALGEW